MQHEYRLSAGQISALLHDLRAPVSNAQGFKTELNEAVSELLTVIDAIGPELSDQNRKRLNDIINDDIIVCSNLLAASVNKLQERVREFEHQFPTKSI